MKKLTRDEVHAILATQYDEKFWKMMVSRMEMSYFKYGDFRDGYPKRIDWLKSLQQRLMKYAETGNTEFLVDAANFAMIEFMAPAHPKAHFQSTDSDQSPGRTSVHGRVSPDPNIIKHSYKHEGD
jgi:hypothetical protein